MDDLEALPPEFRVVGINDYLFLDGYKRVLKERANGRLENLDLVLPVVELRLNIFGGSKSQLSRVNYHVIFSEELEPRIIQEQFLNALTRHFTLAPRVENSKAASAWAGVVTRASLESLGRAIVNAAPANRRSRYSSPLIEGFNNLTLSLEAIQGALEDSTFLADSYLTGVGKTEWADVKWSDGSIADKRHVINSVNCVFTAAESVGAYQNARHRLQRSEVNDRLIDCSDAHHLSTTDEKDRIGNSHTWLKADPTFGGLLQALEEFEHRVFVGDEPPEVRRVREHPSKYMDSVRIRDVSQNPKHDWFSTDLPLNTGLVAIIGNKGSGKSALAEVTGLVGGSPHEEHFSFLTETKFRNPRQGLANRFEGEIQWHTGQVSNATLAEEVVPGAEMRIQHLPQRYLETLCNELPSGSKTDFDAELERIIFAHLPADKQLETSTLSDLIEISTRSVDIELEEQRGVLHSLNERIASLEDRLSPESMLRAQSNYRALRREWLHLKRNPPTEVPEPDEGSADLAEIRQELRQLAEAQEHLRHSKSEVEERLASARRDLAALRTFRTALEGIRRSHEKLREENEELLRRLQIPDDVSTVQLNTEVLDRARDELASLIAELEIQVEPRGNDHRGLHDALEWIRERSEGLRTRLSAPAERRERYLEHLGTWTRDVEGVRGQPDVDDPSTLLGARRQLSELRGVPSQLQDLRARRRDVARQIHHLLVMKASECAGLYVPLQEYMDGQALPTDFRLTIATSLIDTGFADVFLGDFVNRGVAGSFCGIPESERRLGELTAAADFDNASSVLDFIDAVSKHLRVDMRQSSPSQTVPASQVRKGKTVAELYDWIYGLSYLSPRYGLRFGGKPIYQLSPGEKGTLLLLFFLLAEVDTRPLIIDQPEDNLDNNTVYRALVGCFKKAKERRQVIIVTHNPNLAVVCDADQIIVAEMDKSEPVRIRYLSGAIERRDTVRAVVDILEGTQPAFDNRSIKYSLHLSKRLPT